MTNIEDIICTLDEFIPQNVTFSVDLEAWCSGTWKGKAGEREIGWKIKIWVAEGHEHRDLHHSKSFECLYEKELIESLIEEVRYFAIGVVSCGDNI